MSEQNLKDEKDLVFIVSPGRTGTTFLGQILSQIIDDCHSTHEPDVKYGFLEKRTWRNIRTFGLWQMVFGRVLGKTGAMATARHLHSRVISQAEAVSRIRQSRTSFHRQIKQSLIVEANYQWTPLLPELRGAFPDAKIICITRNRDTWVESWLKKGTRHNKRDPVSPRKRLTPLSITSPDAEKWRSMSTEEKLQWEWHFLNKHLNNFFESDPLSALFRYEDLFFDGGVSMRALLDFTVNHDQRCHRYHFDENILSNRINSS